MNYGIADFLSLIGSLGFFIYGMKIMSDSIQKAAGSRLRQFLATMTSNRFIGVFTGFLITCVIQSSSATTVMVVSFVNAGLLSLVESIGVIMGANIGTTITAWLISIFGFKVKIADFSLIIIAFSFPFIFSKNTNFKLWAEVFIGFAFLFMGLEYLKDSVPDLQANPEALKFLSYFSYEDKTYFTKLLTTIFFVFIGTIITIVVQSSSAAMALTLVMTFQGWIPFPLAASMVLGENIGTTITANLAAVVANTNAKRAARAHFIFNTFGVIWMVILMPVFLGVIDWYMIRTNLGSPFQQASSIPIGLSIFHTVFNITNVLLMIWFSKSIAKVVTIMVKSKLDTEEKRESNKLEIKDLDNFDKSISNVEIELKNFSELITEGIQSLRFFISENGKSKKENAIKRKHLKYVAKASNVYDEIITEYLISLSEKELSHRQASIVQRSLELSNDLENIGDLMESMADELDKARYGGIKLKKSHKNQLDDFLKYIRFSLDIFTNSFDTALSNEKPSVIKEEIYLDSVLRKSKNENMMDLLKKKQKAELGVLFTKLHGLAEQMHYRIRNILELSRFEN